MTQDHEEKIQLKLTFNYNKNLPRSFFVLLDAVPLDAIVRITQRERELPVTRHNKYVGSRTWIVPDVDIHIHISQNEEKITEAVYVLHNGKIFEPAFSNRDINLTQITYMSS